MFFVLIFFSSDAVIPLLKTAIQCLVLFWRMHVHWWEEKVGGGGSRFNSQRNSLVVFLPVHILWFLACKCIHTHKTVIFSIVTAISKAQHFLPSSVTSCRWHFHGHNFRQFKVIWWDIFRLHRMLSYCYTYYIFNPLYPTTSRALLTPWTSATRVIYCFIQKMMSSPPPPPPPQTPVKLDQRFVQDKEVFILHCPRTVCLNKQNANKADAKSG